MQLEKWFFGSVDFFQLSANGAKFFGFSEFLAGLALMVLAWTIADVRYRFRVQTAPVPLQGLTFGVVAAVGGLTFLTDLWRAEQWLVPRGNFLTPASWQAVLAALFLVTFLAWAFAFIRPPSFGRLNKKRFLQTLYGVILKGSPAELAVIADELVHSIPAIIRYASTPERLRRLNTSAAGGPSTEPLSKLEGYSNDLLLLFGDRRMCRALVESSPGTAMVVFQEMTKAKKYSPHARAFARNFLTAALDSKDSFIFHEEEGYKTGLLGYHKPLSQAMFADFGMVDALGTLLEPDYISVSSWDADQWRAYCRVVLIAFRAYVEGGYHSESAALYRALDRIGSAMGDLYKLEGTEVTPQNDIRERLHVIVEFILDSVKALDARGEPEYVTLRLRGTISRGVSCRRNVFRSREFAHYSHLSR